MSATTTPRTGRASYRDISLYAPDRSPCAIDLSDNTNLWGPPPNATLVMRGAEAQSLARYPELYASALKATLAKHVGVPADWVVTGCGSDDLLDSAIRAFAEPGDRVAVMDPSFAMIPIFAQMNGLSVVRAPLTRDYDADFDHMVSEEAAIVYLCSPNNPTGTELSHSAIESIIDRTRGIVIVDEAYIDFGGRSAVDLVSRYDRLLVTRTLSKAYGLAGLRVGYAVGAPSLVAEVEKSRGPYKVSSVAAEAANAALTLDAAWVSARVGDVVGNRRRLIDELQVLGLETLPSAANFVLVPLRAAGAVAARLRARGVAVRPFDALPPISKALAESGGEALRITIGPWDMMSAALVALREVLAECA